MTLDLSKYSDSDMLLSAIRSEIDAHAVYTKLAGIIKNAYMKDKFLFLAGEEAKHRKMLEKLFWNKYQKKKLVVPEKTPVPMPELVEPGKDTPVSEVIESAMKAERAAQKFYEEFAGRFPETSQVRRVLVYFSNMELGHYRLLATEYDLMTRQENFSSSWPMMHVGP